MSYNQYVDLTHELGIEPVSEAAYAATDLLSVRETHPLTKEVATDWIAISPTIISGKRVNTWALIEKSMIYGCQDCLSATVAQILHFYGTEEDLQFTDATAIKLVSAMWIQHNVPLAITNLSVDQNWSIMLPVAGCPTCYKANRSSADLFDAIRTGTRQSGISPCCPKVSFDTGGLRSLGAKDFIASNRLAIGFAAILGNPVVVDSEENASLVNAHIRTHLSPQRCEIAGGKGLSLEQAVASCVGEGLERYFLAGAGRTLSGKEPSPDTTCKVGPDIFGFPVNDLHTTVTPWEPWTDIEYQDAQELTAEGVRNVLIPSNLVYCPYSPLDPGKATICTGSTNGVATGATVDDATLQGALELIERDSFWFYARTGNEVAYVSPDLYPKGLIRAKRDLPGDFYVHHFPNPFGIPVAQVVYYDPKARNRTVAARGTGCTPKLSLSVARAFAECMQMLHSLGSGIDVDESPYDMRSLWFSGEAHKELPNFFSNGSMHFKDIEAFSYDHLTVNEIIKRAHAQEIRVFRVILAESTNVAIVRTLFSSINIMDASYFQMNSRFDYFADYINTQKRNIVYSKSLFM